MGDGRPVNRAIKARTSEITARGAGELRSRGTELRSRGTELRGELARHYARMDVRWARCAQQGERQARTAGASAP